MSLALEVIAALYLISFAWFWLLCQMSLPEKPVTNPAPRNPNLIPFERGIELRLRQEVETLTSM